ncbi:MAG: TraB/GumN family protein [Candidatus Sericytochromatia bacterium]
MLKRLRRAAYTSLMLLVACQPAPPVSSPSGSLGNLTLPGAATPSASPSAVAPAANEATPGAVAPSVSNQWVWQVDAPGGARSYLIATVHAPLATDYRLPDSFASQLESVSRFYMEADVEAAEALVQQAVTAAIDLNASLPTKLGETDWARLLTRVAPLGLPPQILPSLRPWYVNLLVSTPPGLVGSPPDKAMDMVLRARAEAAGKPVAFLEAAADQLNALQAVPENTHLSLLKQSLERDDAALQEEYTRIFSLYNRGDVAGLEREEQQAQSDAPDYHRIMVSDRNQAWVVLLTPVLQRENIMVAVGALHLIGSTGLVTQLQTQGLKVTRLQPTP